MEKAMHANLTIASYLGSLVPESKLETVFRSFVEYDLLNKDFETLIFNFLSEIPIQTKTPLNVLFEMIQISDGTKSTKRFNYDSLSYAPLLIMLPNFFGHDDYTQQMVLNDFYQYMHTHPSNNQFFSKFIDYLISQDDQLKFFIDSVANQIIYEFNQNNIQYCTTYLDDLFTLLTSKLYRHHFCTSPHFTKTMFSLFLKSVISSDELCIEFFGIDPTEKFSKSQESIINMAYSSYHQKLVQIMTIILFSDTSKQGLGFIQFALNDLEKNFTRGLQTVGYNFESVLIQIVMTKSSEFGNINPYSPYMKNSLIQILPKMTLAVPGEESWSDSYNQNTADASRLIYGDDIKDIENDNKLWEEKLKEITNQESDLLSLLFFAAIQMMKYGSMDLTEIQYNLSRSYQRMVSEERKKYAKIVIFHLEILLNLDFRTPLMISFFDEVFSFLQKTAQYNVLTKKLPPNPPIPYQRLPEIVLSFPIHIILKLQNSETLNPAELLNFIQKISSLFMCKKYVRNPKIGNDILKFFLSILNGNSEISTLIVTDTVINQVYPTVTEFYARVEKTGSSSEYYDKTNMRRPCVHLLTEWMKYPLCRDYYRKHCHEETNITFLSNLASDVSTYMQKSIEAHYQLIHAKDKSKNHVDQSTAEELKDLASNDIVVLKDQLDSEFEDAHIYSDLLLKIAGFVPEAFNYGSISKIIAASVFKTFYSAFSSTEFFEMPYNNIEYDPSFIIFREVELAVSLMNVDLFKDELVDQFSVLFSEQSTIIFDYIVNHLKEKGAKNLLIPFQNLVSQISPRLAGQTDVVDEEIPEKYLDPITFDILEDPQLLPTGTVISKISLELLKSMKNFKDPIYNTDFDPTQVKPAVELQAEINEYLKNKKSQ